MSGANGNEDTRSPIGLDKRWWALIIVAALGAIGSGLGGRAVDAIWTVCCAPPIDNTVRVQLKDKGTDQGIPNVAVEIISLRTLDPVKLKDGEMTAFTNNLGWAMLDPQIALSADYGIRVTRRLENTTYYHSSQLSAHDGDSIDLFFPDNFPSGPLALNDPIVSGPVGATPASNTNPDVDVPWLQLAFSEVGVREIEGAGSNPRIDEYFASADQDGMDDSVPWSGAFLNYVISESGYVTPDSPLQNRNWLNWGEILPKPRIGCVAVFWRRSPEHWSGHAGLYLGQSGDKIRVIGGNQSNAVSMIEVSADRFLGCRWPDQKAA